MRVLVTGGAGFLGSTLVDRLLAEGHAVDVVDDLSTGRLANLADARADRSNELRVHQVDLRTPEAAALVARRRPEVVFHLAARTGDVGIDDPVADAEVTVLGTLNLLEAARRGGATKVVVASGADVYGEPDPSDLPLREAQAHVPRHPAGAAAASVLHYLRVYRELHGLDFTALVLADVYGPRQERHPAPGVVAAFVRDLLAGEACAVAGDGAQTRDFLFVDDAVDAFVRAASRGSGLVCNVGTGVETSLADLHALVAEQVGVADPVLRSVPASAPAPRRRALAPGRASIHLGWKPWTALPDGVAELVGHLRA